MASLGKKRQKEVNGRSPNKKSKESKVKKLIRLAKAKELISKGKRSKVCKNKKKKDNKIIP